VPAHNEAEQIGATVRSILSQTYPVTRLIVIADNCTDSTAEIAAAHGAEVHRTVDNRHKKAGALNRGFELLRPGEVDYVMQMDADTELIPEFIERCLPALTSPRVGGVCARFIPKPGLGDTWFQRLLVKLQRIEYLRYDGMLSRHRDPSVLSGTASIYAYDALAQVAALYRCPDPRPWNQHSLVEDYRLTLDIKHLGYRAIVPPGARVYTDVPTTFRALWRQRIRWSGGTLAELEKHGWCRYTRRELLTFLLMATSVFGRLISIFLLATVAFVIHGTFEWPLYWLIPIAATLVDRVQTIWRHEDGRWDDIALSVLLIPEEVYALIRESYTTTAVCLGAARRLRSW
jgi:cellulose synthase/poly-beta-1,6-N-acetylglucosamine synthase-like glycosyltransferase